MYVQADIADDDACRSLVAAASRRFGRLDILVNNAGTTKVIPHADLDAATDEVWRDILEVNVLGTWHMIRAAVPALRSSGAGSIVNITSLAGERPVGSSIPYAVSKAGLNHLTLLLAKVLGPQIRVNAVAPGLIDTPWTASWHAMREAVRAQAPLRRSGVPDDVAAAVLGIISRTTSLVRCSRSMAAWRLREPGCREVTSSGWLFSPSCRRWQWRAQ